MGAITGTCINVKKIKDGRSHEDLINPFGNNTFQSTMDDDHSTMHVETIVMVDPFMTTITHQITMVKSHSEVRTKMIDMVDPL